MEIKIDEIPKDVLWVCMMQQAWFVGSETYDKIHEIIEKYPNYFPWEHTYKKVPSEVHQAYRKEKECMYNEMYPPVKYNNGDGIIAQLDKKVNFNDIPLLSFSQFIELQQSAINKEAEYEKRLKKLWDRHYSKYKLEYRG